MRLQVKLAVPQRQLVGRLPRPAEILLRFAGDDLGQARNALLLARQPLHHRLVDAASAVAETEGEEDFGILRFLGVLIPALEHLVGIGLAVVHAGVLRDVREHLRAVQTAPAEEVVGPAVLGLPVQLAGEELVDAATGEDFRQRGGIAKHIRQPAASRTRAELAAEELQAHENLADERFAGGHVAVGFDPHAAGSFPAAGLDPLGDFAEQRRVMILRVAVKLSLRAGKVEVRILLHQPASRGEGASGLANRLAQRPEPRHVDMRVADGKESARAGSAGISRRRLVRFASDEAAWWIISSRGASRSTSSSVASTACSSICLRPALPPAPFCAVSHASETSRASASSSRLTS